MLRQLTWVAMTGLALLRAGPPTLHYRLELRSDQTLDLTILNRGLQTQHVGVSAYLSVLARDTADARILSIEVDSILPDSATRVPRQLVDSARGTAWRVRVGPSGHVVAVERTRVSRFGSLLEPSLTRFVPPGPNDLRAGARWTDTLDTNDSLPDGIMAVRTVTNFLAVEDSLQGARVLRISGSSSTAVSGSQTGPNGSILQIGGTGRGSLAYYVDRSGRYLSSTQSSRQDLSVAGPIAPQPLPVTVLMDVTVRLLAQ